MYTNANKQSIAISDRNVDVDNPKYVDRKENDRERGREREKENECGAHQTKELFVRIKKREIVVIMSVN